MCPDPAWHCAAIPPSEPSVDPVQGAFFTEEGLVDALVREAIQNSLDAAMPDAPTRVRIFWSGTSSALAPARGQRYFHGLLAHAQASLRETPPADSPVPFFVLEDFGTRGLAGDPSDADGQPRDGKKNDFFWFWRNWARSDKDQSARGRWGVGKTVFPACSRLHAFFGLSVTPDGTAPTLMGQAVLKVHKFNDQRHSPYAYWPGVDQTGLPIPSRAPEDIAAFKSDFKLARGTEPGLSIVIPHYEAPEQCRADLFVVSAIRHFFFPLVTGKLSVRVETPDKTVELDSAQLGTIIADLQRGDHGLKETARELANLVRLAHEAHARREEGAPTLTLQETGKSDAPTWEQACPESPEVAAARKAFQRGELIHVRAQVHVHPKGAPASVGVVDAFLRRPTEPEGNVEAYVREGLRIPEISFLRGSQAAALLVVDATILSRLMGDSENPAHTRWGERETRVSEGYVRGASTVRFVKNMLRELVARLSASPEAFDENLLADMFSLPEDPAEETATRPGRQPRPRPDDPPNGVPPIPARPRRIRIHQLEGGFSISAATPDIPPPTSIDVRVAYDVRRGNPFSSYQRYDFQLGQAPVSVDIRNARAEFLEDNRLRLRDVGQDFEVAVRGLDARRDVKVSVTSDEAGDET